MFSHKNLTHKGR